MHNHVLALFLFLLASVNTWSDESLPTLGDTTSGIVSLQKEKELGSFWLKSLRRQAPIFTDPLAEEYLNAIVYRLLPNSQLKDKTLNLIIIDNPGLNAFAVPGGIMGINAGLFLYAQSEDEFAAVIAHEIAHLSQRHYARSLENSAQNAALTLAGMLASIVIAATTGSDAGIAALAGTQALSAQNTLSYSRQNEKEADRIGIQTLYHSNLNPEAMPRMFERMLQSGRYHNKVPEYLSTHPLTESRVSDSQNRADTFPNKTYQMEDSEYQFVKQRVLVHYSTPPQKAVNAFLHATDSHNTVVNKYGLAVAYIHNNEGNRALPILDELLQTNPHRISLIFTKAEALISLEREKEAIKLLTSENRLTPDNKPLQLLLAKAEFTSGNYLSAEDHFSKLSRQHPSDPNIWYYLAETRGLTGKIVELHQARAEYYYLLGKYKSAIQELEYAAEKSGDKYPVSNIIQQRMTEMNQYWKRNKF